MPCLQDHGAQSDEPLTQGPAELKISSLFSLFKLQMLLPTTISSTNRKLQRVPPASLQSHIRGCNVPLALQCPWIAGREASEWLVEVLECWVPGWPEVLMIPGHQDPWVPTPAFPCSTSHFQISAVHIYIESDLQGVIGEGASRSASSCLTNAC